MHYSQKYGLVYIILVLGIGLSSAGMARADTVTFTGTRFAQNPPPSPIGRCAPALTLTNSPSLGISTGTSNLGTFTSEQSHCVTPPFPAPLTNGLFTWTFASGATLSGTYIGAVTEMIMPGVFNETANYTIAGGTGLFSGAIGNIIEIGTVTFPPTGLPFATVNLNGTITAPQLTAVPEPTTMLLLGTGLASVGTMVRRRRCNAKRCEEV